MERKENILGTEKISRLLLKFGVPGAVSLVVNSLYNIVDQIFIGQGVGFLGNAATNLIFPLSVFAVAVGALMLGSGQEC
jgi:Na+-driven multidrug efflux pump